MEHTNFTAVLYCSETGTAEDCAFALFELLSKESYNNVTLTISAMDDFDISLLPTLSNAIFIVPTTGDGDVPSNMKSFWKFLLRRSLGPSCLESVKVAVFGLGDSSYEKYNAAARKLAKRLAQLGAQELLPLALGDEQAACSYVKSFDNWTSELLACFSARYVKSKEHDLGKVSRSHFSIEAGGSEPGEVAVDYHPSNCIVASITRNTRITALDWIQDVRHISFAPLVSSGSPCYITGDVATIYPQNDAETVRRLLAIVLGVPGSPWKSENDIMDIKFLNSGADRKYPLRPSYLHSDIRCSLKQLFTEILDVAGIPRRRFLKMLSIFAKNEEEKEKLEELSAAEGAELYYEYCVRERRNYVEVLEDFRSARPPLMNLLEMIPLLPCRHYSMASSHLSCRDQVDICVAVTLHRTPYGRKRYGICSSYLASLKPGDAIRFRITKALFSGKGETIAPLLLIGPGTGVAPMRGLIHERSARLASIPEGSGFSDKDGRNSIILLFGCRRRTCDYLFAGDWNELNARTAIEEKNELQEEGNVINSSWLTVLAAFSQEKGQLIKVYVTHKIRENARAIANYIRQDGAMIMISGASKRMPSDVRLAIREALIAFPANGISSSTESEVEADRYLNAMVSSGRYLVEAW